MILVQIDLAKCNCSSNSHIEIFIAKDLNQRLAGYLGAMMKPSMYSSIERDIWQYLERLKYEDIISDSEITSTEPGKWMIVVRLYEYRLKAFEFSVSCNG